MEHPAFRQRRDAIGDRLDGAVSMKAFVRPTSVLTIAHYSFNVPCWGGRFSNVESWPAVGVKSLYCIALYPDVKIILFRLWVELMPVISWYRESMHVHRDLKFQGVRNG